MDGLEALKRAIKEDPDNYTLPPDRKERVIIEKSEDFLYDRIENGKVYLELGPIRQQPILTPKKPGVVKVKYCDTCGGNFTNHTLHRRTKVHQAYEQMNTRLKHIVLNLPRS